MVLSWQISFGNGGKSGSAIERWFVTLWCPLDPRLFASRFRQGVGTLVTHGKAGVCARISITYIESKDRFKTELEWQDESDQTQISHATVPLIDPRENRKEFFEAIRDDQQQPPTDPKETEVSTLEDLRNVLSETPTEGGAVYLLPDLKTSFTSFSWLVVFPDGEIAMNRWAPHKNEDVNIIKKENIEPATTPLNMWKRCSLEETLDHFQHEVENGYIKWIKQIGEIQYRNNTPFFNLSNPEKHTETRY